MTLIGVGSMIFFWWEILKAENRGYPWLYFLLLLSLFILSAKLLYEWYHYWHISIPEKPQKPQKFTVDVLTTFCPGEPYEMIENCLRAIQAMPYPHVTYLCDEANDSYLKELCRQLGVKHVTRTNRRNAKAGNINNALQQASGEICLVLDPDHIVEPNFLDEIVPHFTDPKIGFVQTVQAYHNIHESLVSKGAAQQTFQFYGPLMMTMNSYGTAQAIGANCTFRRAALDSIGGHAPGLAEDMHTSMRLHAQGWQSVYVPRLLARGQVPSTLSAYLKQQLKWSKGVFDLLFQVYPGLFRRLSFRQKIHYGLLPFFYTVSLAFLINFFLPIFTIFSEKMPIRIDLVEFTLLGSPLFITAIALRHYAQNWLMEERERGFHIVGGLLLIGTWWIHLTGIVFAILGRKVPYNPTPKDNKEENNWPLIFPNLIIMALSIAAGVKGLLDRENPYFFMMASLALLNVLFTLFYLAAGRQKQYRRVIETNPRIFAIDHQVRRLRTAIWLFNHRLFTQLRAVAAALVLLVAGGAYYFLWNWPSFKYQLSTTPDMQAVIDYYHQAEGSASPKLIDAKKRFSESYTIIPPAKVLYPGQEGVYWAARLQQDNWQVIDYQDSAATTLRWYLLRFDDGDQKTWGGPATRLRELGSGAAVRVKIPERQRFYRLMLEVVENEPGAEEPEKRYSIIPLHTPFPNYATLLPRQQSQKPASVRAKAQGAHR